MYNSYPDTELRVLAINRLNILLSDMMSHYDICQINFNPIVSGVSYFSRHFYLSDGSVVYNCKMFSSRVLLSLIRSLESGSFYGYCRTVDSKFVKIIPRGRVPK